MNIKAHTIKAHKDAQRRAILRWAEVAASEHHELEIIVPPEFDRQQALDALEIAVVRKYSLSPLVQLGQGRTEADTPWSDAGLLVVVAGGAITGLLAIYVLVRWLV